MSVFNIGMVNRGHRSTEWKQPPQVRFNYTLNVDFPSIVMAHMKNGIW